jgi:hypothetical protein
MRQDIDLDGIWADVRRLAVAEFEAEDQPPPALPAICPLPLEALLDAAADRAPLPIPSRPGWLEDGALSGPTPQTRSG